MSKQCTFDPTIYKGQPIGMFHCPLCGDMVIAGLPHGPSLQLDDEEDLEMSKFNDHEYLLFIKRILHDFIGTKAHVILEDNYVDPKIDRDDALNLISSLLTDLETHLQIGKENGQNR